MVAHFTTIIAALAALASASPIAHEPLAKRSINSYCDDSRWYISGTYLGVECRADNGELLKQTLDLNTCLANLDGKLIHYPGGGFAASCEVGSLSLSSGSTVCTYCTAADGSRKLTCPVVDEFATVNNGIFSCQK